MRASFEVLIFALFVACAAEPAALLPESEGPRTEVGTKALLPARGAVISRPVAGDEPGETELFYQPASAAEEARVLFPAPGADDRPALLPDGRLLFVSTRSTIASLWIGDLATGELTQLTNRGLAAGKSREGRIFTPPPHGPIAIKDQAIEYDAGGGRIVRVELSGGAK